MPIVGVRAAVALLVHRGLFFCRRTCPGFTGRSLVRLGGLVVPVALRGKRDQRAGARRRRWRRPAAKSLEGVGSEQEQQQHEREEDKRRQRAEVLSARLPDLRRVRVPHGLLDARERNEAARTVGTR